MNDTLVGKLRARLNRGDSWLTYDLGRLFSRDGLDGAALEELESRLLAADAGVEVTQDLVELLRTRVKQGRIRNEAELREVLGAAIEAELAPCEKPLAITGAKPFVILMVGVNGVGKTTTLGKLALRLKRDGHAVLLAAGDTFRAAAAEQLAVWAERAGAPLVAQSGGGGDSAAVIHDALQAARARNADVVIADTAGRLHTQGHLMEELKKVQRVIRRFDPSAPHEVLLVLDATTGSNALAQAGQFGAALGVTGLVLTKLDGTARGGTVLALARRLRLPIRYIGVGEAAEDLVPFEAAAFARALIA